MIIQQDCSPLLVPDLCEFLPLPLFTIICRRQISFPTLCVEPQPAVSMFPTSCCEISWPLHSCEGLNPSLKKQQLNEGAGRRELKMRGHKTDQSPASSCWQAAHWPLDQRDIRTRTISLMERGVRVCREFTACWKHLFSQVSKASSVICGIERRIINLMEWLCNARKWKKSASTLARAVKPAAALHVFSSLSAPERSRIVTLLLLSPGMILPPPFARRKTLIAAGLLFIHCWSQHRLLSPGVSGSNTSIRSA